jgi:MFS family permease
MGGMMVAEDTRQTEERYGWVMVGVAAMVIGIGFGTLWSFPIFIKPLSAEFGWLRGEISFAYAAATLLIGVMGIVMGDLADRFSARPLVLMGAIVLGASQILLGQIQSLWQLYVIYGFLVGGLAISAFYVPLVANVGFWFERNKGLAIGVTLGGQVAGAAVVPFIVRILISDLGWRETYMAMGVAIWILLIPITILIRRPPRHGKADGKAAAPRNWTRTEGAPISPARLTTVLSVAIVFCCICMSIPLIHAVSKALDAGIDPKSAAAVLSLMMIGGFVGRVGAGKISDHIGGLPTLLLASGTQMVTVFWFSHFDGIAGLYVLSLVFGVGYGGVMPSYAIIIREYIPANLAGRALGIVYCLGNVGMGLGGYFGGLLFDLRGAYTLTFALGVPVSVINLMIIATLWRIMRARTPSEPAIQPA